MLPMDVVLVVHRLQTGGHVTGKAQQMTTLIKRFNVSPLAAKKCLQVSLSKTKCKIKEVKSGAFHVIHCHNQHKAPSVTSSVASICHTSNTLQQETTMFNLFYSGR